MANKTIEEMLAIIGDNFRELTRHYSSKEWTATAIPKEAQGLPHQKWKPKAILSGGKTPQEALSKLLNKLNMRVFCDLCKREFETKDESAYQGDLGELNRGGEVLCPDCKNDNLEFLPEILEDDSDENLKQ